MSALPESHEVVADTAAPEVPETPEAEVRNLYAIPRPEPETYVDDDEAGWFGQIWEKAQEDFTPPAIWTAATPSPAEELNRAKYGTHLQSTGPLRTSAIVYSGLAGAFTVRDKVKIWLRSHPSRFAVAVLVLSLLLASPARPVVAWILFGVPHLAFEALTG